jgi:hypothetical protein
MKTMQAATDKSQETKRDAQERDTYRAPRLISLGTAISLVQYHYQGKVNDYQNRSFL